MKTRTVLTIIPCAFLVSCATFAPPPTPTPLPTFTPTDTPTPLPTDTPAPTATLEPTSTPDALADMIPTGQPAENWKGIPIMPGAISGEGNEQGYTFTIKATPEEIQDYYDRELRKLGAAPFAVGQGDEKNTVLVIYLLNGSPLSISIFPREDFILVMIVK